jgi:hypothetical protein
VAQAFLSLKRLLYDTYSKQLPRNLSIRVQREWKIIQSTYIGNVVDFIREAEEYMVKAQAHEKLASDRCPLADSLNAMQHLLEFLVHKNAIYKKTTKSVISKTEQVMVRSLSWSIQST